MKILLTTAALALASVSAAENTLVNPVLTQIQPDCSLVGADWQDLDGFRIDDLSNLQELRGGELEVAQTLRKQLQPVGIVAVADYSCGQQKAPLDVTTVRVFVFENFELATGWWQKKYQYDGWEKHYTKPANAKHPTVDSTELAKRAMLVGNLWITSHHIQPGNEHLMMLENVLDLLQE